LPTSRVSFMTLVAGSAAIIGCATTTPRVSETQSSSDYVTSIEVAATPASSAYDLVSRLRPNWLRPGGIGSVSGGRISGQVTLVYLDGNKMGEIDVLKSISASGVQTMRWLDAVRAQTVLRGIGTEAIAGAIVLTTTNR
jgi:hypothetical protein